MGDNIYGLGQWPLLRGQFQLPRGYALGRQPEVGLSPASSQLRPLLSA